MLFAKIERSLEEPNASTAGLTILIGSPGRKQPTYCRIYLALSHLNSSLLRSGERKGLRGLLVSLTIRTHLGNTVKCLALPKGSGT
jgi:hypothetical protein